MIRKFYLINKYGVQFDLQNNNHFATNPAGLGFEREIETIKVNNNLNIKSEANVFPDISFDINFREYIYYNQFVSFLAVGDIRLAYIIPGVGIFTKNVLVNSLEKTEIGDGNVLTCAINLVALTPFLGGEKNYQIKNSETKGKEYDYKYDYKYGSDNQSKLRLINLGNLNSPLNIIISGQIDNTVKYRLLDNDKVIQSGSITIERFTETDKLIINSYDREVYVERSDGEIVNAFQFVDLEYPNTTFISIPPGTFTFEILGLGNLTTCDISYKENWSSV